MSRQIGYIKPELKSSAEKTETQESLKLEDVYKLVEIKSKKITDAEDAKPKKIIEQPKGEYKPRKSLSNKNSLLSKLRKADGSS